MRQHEGLITRVTYKAGLEKEESWQIHVMPVLTYEALEGTDAYMYLMLIVRPNVT